MAVLFIGMQIFVNTTVIGAPGKSLTITSPQGGEYWLIGSVHAITWVTGDDVGTKVKLQYSIDNQVTWQTITSSTDNDGTYNWKVPSTASDTCNIKISDTSDSSVYNISYGTFYIVSLEEMPKFSLNHTNLYYGALKSSSVMTGAQTIIVNNSGPGVLHWKAETIDQDYPVEWLKINNISGSQSGRVEVTVEPVGLPVGSYTGRILFTDPNASNSPQTVWVYLQVYGALSDASPFGTFETPDNNSTVRSSIPVTGWVLDDIGIKEVAIYRDSYPGEKNDKIYIGKGMQVEGVRPDVEQNYPTYPMSYKAGWGYMLLTNMLPNGGNGTYVLHAYVKDLADHEVYLGSKTITCDNGNAVKPFGAIDTPDQGGDATGTSYRNQGWVLTPQPNKIPEDGSTIAVYIDGQNIGNVIYNIYRLDIATLFPGHANSEGALAYLDFDTTAYESGLHTIQWTAVDNAGNTDGIGSRYFVTIQNTGYVRHETGSSLFSTSEAPFSSSYTMPVNKPWHDKEDLLGMPLDDVFPVKVKTGYNPNTGFKDFYADETGVIRLVIPQDERIVVDLNQPGYEIHSGYLEVANVLRSLPPGSVLDREKGIFYWQPGPASLGEYSLVFISEGKSGFSVKRNISIKIIPKFNLKKELNEF